MRLRVWGVLLVLIQPLALTACGQKGPLFLPSTPQVQPQPASIIPSSAPRSEQAPS
ncbi:MAG: Prokaryotic lipoprotein-attachment site [Pseudomonadota bacterium]